jgi:hypothetical protein
MKSARKKARIRGQDLLSRLGGVSASLTGGGISFKLRESERNVVREVLAALEDRRALYVDFDIEIEDQVVSSLMQIRKDLTDGLKRVVDGSPAAAGFRSMRAACREFLSEPHSNPELGRRMGRHAREEDNFFAGLGKLRGVFGQQIAQLAYLYDLDVEKELASILPPEPQADDEDDAPERRYWRY